MAVLLGHALVSRFCECSSFQVSKAACILTTQTLMRLLKSREAAGAVDVKTWPTIIDTGELLGPRGSLKFCAGVTSEFQRDCPPFHWVALENLFEY